MGINYDQKETVQVTLVMTSATCDRCSADIPILYKRNPENASQVSAEGWYAGFIDPFLASDLPSSLLCKTCCEALWDFMGWDRKEA